MPPPHSLPPIPALFHTRKSAILSHLSTPAETYTDASPKGSVDAGIVGLIDRINAIEGLVTTSSCAGRISVFVEGRKGTGKKSGRKLRNGRNEVRESQKPESENDRVDEKSTDGYLETSGKEDRHQSRPEQNSTLVQHGNGSGVDIEGVPVDTERGQDINGKADKKGLSKERKGVPGGKGNGGRWLFVSHEALSKEKIEGNLAQLLGLPELDRSDKKEGLDENMEERRLVRFQFEPMILHVMCASLHHAQHILSSAINAGFRESGVQSLKNLNDENAFPMVALRTSGLAFESLVAYVGEDEIEQETIRSLVDETYLRILVQIANERFGTNAERRRRFESLLASSKGVLRVSDPAERQMLKKAEGLKRQVEVRNGRHSGIESYTGKADVILMDLMSLDGDCQC
ncbi:uncharacterized protein KY384_006356 [Bacidia gigantensis]|uniref:uncharacterized protein n=1 Tax=Bacidia gigantensis TaxID=2732470 RepID=UPI001D051794|nr:uncharacterized protein KY384_006356 [Bacidia gigantensis]KAG8528669.1 hypothetical protein KY384_006356 [Bacidia gigantensis]